MLNKNQDLPRLTFDDRIFYTNIQGHNQFVKDRKLSKNSANLLFWLISMQKGARCNKRFLLELTNLSYEEFDESCRELIEFKYLVPDPQREPGQETKKHNK